MNYSYNKLAIVQCIYRGVTGYNCISFYEDHFFLTNSGDPDEMLHFVVFHLDLQLRIESYISLFH